MVIIISATLQRQQVGSDGSFQFFQGRRSRKQAFVDSHLSLRKCQSFKKVQRPAAMTTRGRETTNKTVVAAHQNNWKAVDGKQLFSGESSKLAAAADVESVRRVCFFVGEWVKRLFRRKPLLTLLLS